MTASPTRRSGDELSDLQFSRVACLLHEHFGIDLPEHKRASISRRLNTVFRGSSSPSFDLFFAESLGAPPDFGVLSELIDKASTNHTYFWREPEHFKLFSEVVLPELARRLSHEQDLRIWCAAAATGEEPVTLALLAMDYFRFKGAGWRCGVLATDISASALEHARAGLWSSENVLRLPVRLRRHFRQAGPAHMRLVEHAANELTWRRLNLVAQAYPFQRKMHVVFCRNVLIYFDKETKAAVIERIHDVVAPGGWLFLSHSETIGRDSVFEYVQPGVYRRRTS
ncbi:MAG: chemotaxis protein methyltransferase CheR [Cognaticolwellia sp.]